MIKVRLDDLVTLQRGFDITKKEQVNGNVPVISSGGIASYHNQAKVKGPGVVIGRKGTLGKVFYSDVDFWPHDTSLWVKDFHGNDPKFIYYLLQILHFEKFDAGAANPTLNRNHVHSLKFYAPKFEDRPKIASILTAYDDLIETNNQRINLLNEMAEEIYKEWFVRLRFPGYKESKFYDKNRNEVSHNTQGALPEEWSVQQVGNIVERKDSGKKYDNKTSLQIGEVPILDQGQSGLIGYHNEEPGVTANMEEPIIVFANHTCYQNLIQFNFSTIQNVLPFISNQEFNRNIFWLHYATKDLISFNDYKGHWPEFITKRIVIPKKGLCTVFGKIIKPMMNEKHLLKNKNQILQETRDLLLPRLISGKLSVENIEIKDVEN